MTEKWGIITIEKSIKIAMGGFYGERIYYGSSADPA